MKKAIVMAAMLALMAGAVYASDYQGEERQGSVFQKLGDLIKGDYKVKGKPIKEKGVIQVMADQVQDVEPAAVR